MQFMFVAIRKILFSFELEIKSILDNVLVVALDRIGFVKPY